MDKDFLPGYLVDTFFLNSCLIYSYLIARDFPVQVFPALDSPAVELKAHVPFEHIKNTFSNRIGLISNASISIGQTEYGKPLNSSSNSTNQVLVTKPNASSAPVPPSCAPSESASTFFCAW